MTAGYVYRAKKELVLLRGVHLCRLRIEANLGNDPEGSKTGEGPPDRRVSREALLIRHRSRNGELLVIGYEGTIFRLVLDDSVFD